MYLCDDNSFIDESMKTKFQLAACFLLVGYLIFLAACGQRSKFYDQFSQIDSLADVRPQEADSLLRDLAPAMAESAEVDSMYYALLRLKTDDKLYRNITDRRDLALRLVNYYGHHNKFLLPTALFYAGRVCADLGDSPQALDYYQKTLDAMPETNSRLRRLNYEQMGYIFHGQALYEDAVLSFRNAYALNKDAGDTLGMVYNLRDIAVSFKLQESFDSCRQYFMAAQDLAIRKGLKRMRYDIQAQLAGTYCYMGQTEKALLVLRPALAHADSADFRSVCNFAAEIYWNLQEKDSARYYFNLLQTKGNIYGKRTAHEKLAELCIQDKQPDLAITHLKIQQMLADSIRKLDNAAIVKRVNAMYNYQIHEKTAARLKIQNEQRWRMLALAMFVAVVCTLLLIILLVINHNNRRIQRVKLENLKKESEGKSKDIIMARNRIAELEDQLATNIESALLQQEILIQKSNLEYAEKMQKAQLERRQNAEAILFGSEIYLAVKKKAEEGKTMNTTEWQAFETVINQAYPYFSARLRELCKLSEQELHVSLLLKARFTNKDIATLTCRERNSISMTCLRLYKKAFHEDQTYKTWTDFIEIL